MASIPAYATGFAVFDRQQLSAESFDAGRAEARDELAVVFFRGLECLNCGLNCEIARKTMPVQPDTIRALSFRWFHSNVYEHREPDQRSMLYGAPAWLFFYRGKRLAPATGWHDLGRFEAASLPRGRRFGPSTRKRVRTPIDRLRAKVRPIEKN